ncbi:hypothetical protein ACI7YT_12370 [Microbacterium sp. M]|uniref:hypothetical protein n=1 Tax=Microbacterium sp. M TaxID=3377125 RepID=UPI0038639F8B
MNEMREIAKLLARRDREGKTALVQRRRRAGLKQSEIDRAFGFLAGWTKRLEAYDSDPTLSDLRRYEAYIILAEGRDQTTNHEIRRQN